MRKLYLLKQKFFNQEQYMEGAENKQTKSKKDTFAERLKAKYPEQNFDQEEDFFGRVNDDYDEYENQIAGYKKHESELSDMFTSDPRSANFLMNWKNGQDPAIALVRQFGTDIKDAIDDPEKLEEIEKANKEYVERVAKEKELEGQYEENLQKSLANLAQMQQETGLSDDEIDAAMELIATISKDFIVGKITPETMKIAFNAINHDNDVATAGEEGEVRGRNAKIEEKLRKSKKGDGTASLNGKNGSPKPAKPQKSLGALEHYGNGNQSIWERGGEKRTKA